MAAVSRFVEFSSTGATLVTGASTDQEAFGTRGFSRATGLDEGEDTFSVVLNGPDQLNVAINGVGPRTITLASGTGLDPRFVARDIAFKLHSADADAAFVNAQCEWRNGHGPISNPGPNTRNEFIIWSGRLGNNGATNVVNVTTPGGRDARTLLGFDSVTETAGVDLSTSYTGDVTVSGVYSGQFDDFYTVQITDGELIGGAVGDGGNTYGGTATTDGMFIGGVDDVYTVTIGTSNGTSMGNGSGNVPTFVVTDTQSDSNATPIELLYADQYYDMAANGVRIKFSDAVFANNDFFTINAFTASGTGGAPGVAKYIWTSSLGDSSKSIGITPQTTENTGTQVGTKSVEIIFSGASTLGTGERFNIMCRGPQPTDSDVTQLNFGNVTVSTSSPVKVVWFELISGAVSMSTVKFSLQANGTFQHHDTGDLDTDFRYGTSGAGNSAPGAGGATAGDQAEFSVDGDGLGNIVAGDIDNTSPPSNLFATDGNLLVVSSADDAKAVGNFQGAVVSDFIYLAIRLGASETGANSTINYRMFFDFS